MAYLAIPPALRPHVKTFVRYCTVGATNTVLDFAIYTILTRGWPFWRAHYLFANACSFVVVVTWSFFWHRRWTFRDRSSQRLASYVKFVTVTLGGIAIAQSVLFVGVRFFHVMDLIAKVFAGPLVVLWNFLMYRCWAFRGSRRVDVASSTDSAVSVPVSVP
ncbi:GtrA family protein [Candidatus Uhrbacteria bacterium]|nr:GtrA family protein [Candidatus Uhrbacteria bacterium]